MTFRERYQYDARTDLLGKGGFSRVYKARDVMLERTVALKFFTAESTDDRYDVLAEIRRAIKFNHPNLVKYYDVQTVEVPSIHGIMERSHVGILEYVNSGSLYDFVKKRPNPEAVKNVIKGILEGLKFIHDRQLIHRDIKPQNILMHYEQGVWTAKIADFGISKSLKGGDAQSSALVGTVEYMAPEQFNPRKFGINGHIDTNVDLWSFGVILYEIFSGEPFFGKRSAGMPSEEIMSNILDRDVPKKFSNLREPYKSIVSRCLVKNAAERARSAGELIELLDNAKSYAEAPTVISQRPTQPSSGSIKGRVAEPKVTTPEKKISPLAWLIPLIIVVIAGVVFGITRILPSHAENEKTEIAENKEQEKPLPVEEKQPEPEPAVKENIEDEATTKEKEYKALVDRADFYFNQQDYPRAKELYSQAKQINRYDQHVTGRLHQIGEKELLSTLNNKEVDSKLSSKDDRMSWEKALDEGTIDAYQRYLYKYPQGDYAAQAKKLIQDAQEKKNFLNRFISDGDRAMSNEDFDQAIVYFDQALSYAVEENDRNNLNEKISACKSKKASKTVISQPEKKEESVKSISVNDHSAKLKNLLGSDKGVVIRGVDFSMGVNDINDEESGKKTSSTDDYTAYTINLTTDGKEKATVSYFFKSQLLSGITIKTEQVNQDSADELYKTAKMYFQQKFKNGEEDAHSYYYSWKNLTDPKSRKRYQIDVDKESAPRQVQIQIYLR